MRGSPPVYFNLRREKLWRKFLAALAVIDPAFAEKLSNEFAQHRIGEDVRQKAISAMDTTS